MRCPNCGWPNKPNESICVKCGSSLQVDQQGNAQSQTASQANQFGGASGESLNKTVMETDAFESLHVEPSPALLKNEVCPKCGYPMRPDSNKCPNCNYIVGGQMEKTICESDKTGASHKFQRQPTRQVGPSKQEPIQQSESRWSSQQSSTQRVLRSNGTVNPYLQGYEYTPTPTFSLKPLPREGEIKVPAKQELEMEDESFVLNRNNTEPTNPTITSHEQALVSRTEDGRWFIENRSAQGTTFVQVNKRTELQDGDVLLLGNRLFEFKIVE